MKKLIHFLIDHLKTNFNLGIYSYTVLFIAASIYISYQFNIYQNILSPNNGNMKGILFYFLVNVVGYYGVAIPLLIFRRKTRLIFNPSFWLISFIFLILIALERGIYFHQFVFDRSSNYLEGLYLYKILANLKGIAVYIIPLFILKSIHDKNSKVLYGLRTKNAFLRPFVFMLLIVLPLVGWASFQPDFQVTYPIFKPWLYPHVFGLQSWLATIIFEAAYSIDFIMLELIFRGALVIGMASILGKDAVLPMVSVYVMIHFGKPLAETISSAFGGYILGVIALGLRNIWGGVFIHVGLALMMEVAALLQHFVRN
ncbi:MAG: hypothetical protein ISR55_08235 [Bacteroidetes bacterium]|nr:hypothetical protein [Bacteroidota bacterium]